jgi:hypothetical protein
MSLKKGFPSDCGNWYDATVYSWVAFASKLVMVSAGEFRHEVGYVNLRQHNQGLTALSLGLWVYTCPNPALESPPCTLVNDEIPTHPQIKWDVDEKRESACQPQPEIFNCQLPSDSHFVSVKPAPVLSTHASIQHVE